MSKKLPFLLIICAVVATFSIAVQAQTRPRKTAVKPVLSSSGAVKTASGLTYLVTKKGAGRRPRIGQTVVVHYTGMFTNGVKFDSSRDRSQPLPFRLGKGEVIKGWDEGIGKLRIGDQAILIIPSAIAYGPKGRGSIPPDTTLIFIVELVDIK